MHDRRPDYGWPAGPPINNLMDTPIAHKPTTKFNKLGFVAVAVIALTIVALSALFLLDNSDATRDLVWAEVRLGDLEQTSPGIGRFISTRQRIITAQEPGKVREIHANVGDQIPAGGLLVTLASPQLENDLTSTEIEVRREKLQSLEKLEAARRGVSRAEIEVSSARIALKTARAENEMNQELFEDRVISRLEATRSRSRVDEAEMRLEGARLELASARGHLERQQTVHEETLRLGELKLEQLRKRIQALEIRALEGGAIKRLDSRLGDNVGRGEVLAEVGPREPDGARLRFPQRDLDRLQPGVPVSLRFLDQAVEARIVRVLADLVDGMVTAEVRAGKLPDNARIDMAVRGDAQLGRLKQVLYARLPATPGPNGMLDVWLERNGSRQRVRLKGIQTVDGHLVFSSGVEPGDRVALIDDRA